MTIKHYKTKATIALSILLIFLAATFILALTNPSFHFINIGLPKAVENAIVATLSFCTMLLVVWEIKHL